MLCEPGAPGPSSGRAATAAATGRQPHPLAAFFIGPTRQVVFRRAGTDQQGAFLSIRRPVEAVAILPRFRVVLFNAPRHRVWLFTGHVIITSRAHAVTAITLTPMRASCSIAGMAGGIFRRQ